MSEESLDAWVDYVLPYLSESRIKVVNALILFFEKTHRHPTTKELANSMNTYPNNISGRLTELVELGIVTTFKSKGKGKTYRTIKNRTIRKEEGLYTKILSFDNMKGNTKNKRKLKAEAWSSKICQSLLNQGYTVISSISGYTNVVIKYRRKQ